jgi:hypothetical protein
MYIIKTNEAAPSKDQNTQLKVLAKIIRISHKAGA